MSSSGLMWEGFYPRIHLIKIRHDPEFRRSDECRGTSEPSYDSSSPLSPGILSDRSLSFSCAFLSLSPSSSPHSNPLVPSLLAPQHFSLLQPGWGSFSAALW